MPIVFIWTDGHTDTQSNTLPPNNQLWGSLTLVPNYLYLATICDYGSFHHRHVPMFEIWFAPCCKCIVIVCMDAVDNRYVNSVSTFVHSAM